MIRKIQSFNEIKTNPSVIFEWDIKVSSEDEEDKAQAEMYSGNMGSGNMNNLANQNGSFGMNS
jgi:hypothetical protein